MNAKQVVKELIQKRQMQAIKNQIGPKLTVVAQNFGQPIVSAGHRQTNPTYWEEKDGFYVEDFEDIHTVQDDEEWLEYEMGWYFDSLRFGVNMSVLVLTSIDDNERQRIVEIKATYNGYVVFAEIEGKIKAYAPFKAWEDALNNLFDGASKADKRRKEREKIEQAKENRSKLDKIWQTVRMLWGG